MEDNKGKEEKKRALSEPLGVYIMQVACQLTGMHPQTLRKYERAGFLKPSRQKHFRMYSGDDINRLIMIKRLVEEEGLNLAGVELVLNLCEKIKEMKLKLETAKDDPEFSGQMSETLDDMLGIIESE